MDQLDRKIIDVISVQEQRNRRFQISFVSLKDNAVLEY